MPGRSVSTLMRKSCASADPPLLSRLEDHNKHVAPWENAVPKQDTHTQICIHIYIYIYIHVCVFSIIIIDCLIFQTATWKKLRSHVKSFRFHGSYEVVPPNSKLLRVLNQETVGVAPLVVIPRPHKESFYVSLAYQLAEVKLPCISPTISRSSRIHWSYALAQFRVCVCVFKDWSKTLEFHRCTLPVLIPRTMISVNEFDVVAIHLLCIFHDP